MAPPVSSADVFCAVADPQRRHILNLLRRGERSVNDIAQTLQLKQPQASKHLRVLKEVDLVRVRGAGQRRLYALKGDKLKEIHDWVTTFAQFWTESLDRLDDYLKELQSQETPAG